MAAVQADLRADAGLILNLLDGLIAVNGLRVTNRLTPTSVGLMLPHCPFDLRLVWASSAEPFLGVHILGRGSCLC